MAYVMYEEKDSGVLEVMKGSALIGLRMGAALASGQPHIAVLTLLTDVVDDQRKSLKRIERKLDQMHRNIARLMYAKYKTGYSTLQIALQTNNREKRESGIEEAIKLFTEARHTVPLPFEEIDSLLQIGICYFLLYDENRAHISFAAARTRLAELQNQLRSPNCHLTVVKSTKSTIVIPVDIQSRLTRMGQSFRTHESRKTADNINELIRQIEVLDALKWSLPDRIKQEAYKIVRETKKQAIPTTIGGVVIGLIVHFLGRRR